MLVPRLRSSALALALATALAVVMGLVAPQAASASPLSYGENPSASAYVNATTGSTNTNYSAPDPLLSSPSTYRAYLQFPLSIPTGATITSVYLYFYNETSGLTSGVEMHAGTANTFNQGPGSGATTCYQDANPCITWNNQPYGSLLATSSTPALNSAVQVTLPNTTVSPGQSSVVLALRSLTAGVIEHIAGATSTSPPVLQVNYSALTAPLSESGATYNDASLGNTNTNHGGATALLSSPLTYYAWVQFDLTGCGAGTCGLPAHAIQSGAVLTVHNITSGEAGFNVQTTQNFADNWVPGTGGDTGDATCYLNTNPCWVYSNQSHGATVTTYNFGGSSAGATAVIPGLPATDGFYISYALRGTTSGLVDSINNTTDPPTLQLAYTDYG